MKSLRQILEKWNSDHTRHHETIDGHHVSVGAYKYDHSDLKDALPNHHSLDFTVNGSWNRRGGISPTTIPKILHHVRQKTDEYISHHKPERMALHPADRSFLPMYRKHAAAIAKKHGYEEEHIDGGYRGIMLKKVAQAHHPKSRIQSIKNRLFGGK